MKSIPNKTIIKIALLAWLIFVGIDFLFHASLFRALWKEDAGALKAPAQLALLIPAGYLSFLLLCSLLSYVFFKLFKAKPKFQELVHFAFIFSILYSAANFFGLYSYIKLSLKQLIAFNLVYFIELFFVTLSLYYMTFVWSLKKSFIYAICIFFSLLVTGIFIQNLFP